MSIFENLESYGFIHHRALNQFDKLNEARSLAREHPGLAHLFEGDLCWNFENGREDLYFRHPHYVFDTLSAKEIDRQMTDGELVPFDIIDELIGEQIYLIIELKVGRGNKERALTKMIGHLEEKYRGRYWIDAFSLSLLGFIRQNHPRTPLTLHTELVVNGRALVAAPEFTVPHFRNIKGLDVDGVAIRWHGSDRFMRNASQGVTNAGKKLVLSRIHNEAQFHRSKEWGAVAGYVHGDLPALFEREI